MFYSLKSRALLIASLMLIIVIAIASYGRIIFEDTILYSVENTQKQHDLNRIIVSMKYPLSSIEGKLYQYLISLDDKDKDYIPLYLFELQTQLENLKIDNIVNESAQFSLHVQKLDTNIHNLMSAFTKLSNYSRSERYPITQLIEEKLNPSSNQFFSAIQILTDNLDELKNEEGMADVRYKIQELRYAVAQLLSSTRLLFITKTGVFGTTNDTLNFVLKNQVGYKDYLNDIIAYFENYLSNNLDDIDLDIEFAINELIAAKNLRVGLSEEIIATMQSKQWRQDLFFLENTLKPILSSIQGEFNLMERRLEKLAATNTIQTRQASNLLSNFLWLFAGIIIVFFITIYFFIEKWLRTPLIKISNAMNFERGQVTGNALTIIGLEEIDHVITAFNHMRKEIKVRQERLSYILQNVGEGIIVVDEHGKIDSFNATAEDIFKTSQSAVLNKDISQLLNIHSIQSDIQWLSQVDSKSRNKHLNYFLDGRRHNGDSFKSDVTVSLMSLNEKNYAIIVTKDATKRLKNQLTLERAKNKAEDASKQFELQVIQLDQSMTELKETQQQLIESEKNASLSGLVAGVAHEINTPIGVSVTASSHLGEEIQTLNDMVDNNSITKTDLNDFITDALEASQIIDSNLQRAANLVKSFKMVAVDQTSNEIRDINLKTYLDEVILNLRPRLKKTKHVIDNNIDASIDITTSPGAISQIFTNFILNSLIHGFEDKAIGHITISSALKNNALILNYEDDGKGMNEEHRKKIFDPFFTTKRGSGGSGLGMHIVLNLLTQTLHGSILCDSEINKGCRFELTIPIQA